MDIIVEVCLYEQFFPIMRNDFCGRGMRFNKNKKKNLTFNNIDYIWYIFLGFGVHFCIDKSLLYKNFEVLRLFFKIVFNNEKNDIFKLWRPFANGLLNLETPVRSTFVINLIINEKGLLHFFTETDQNRAFSIKQKKIPKSLRNC